MAAQDVIEQLLALPDAAAQRRFLQEHQSQLDDSWAEALKEKVIQFQRSDIQRALQTAGLVLYLAELTCNPLHRALGLRAEAQARAIGLGEYQRALILYDEAMQICIACDDLVGHARIQVTRVYPLACLGRYAEAFETGRWASQSLEEHAQWRSLATLTMNLALIHGRLGEDAKALAMFDKAQNAYQQLGADGEPFWAQAEQNRAIVLRNLGQFEASIRASEKAWEMMSRLGQWVEAARARQNLAVTYFVLGRYNEALGLLDQVLDVFVKDGRQRDATLVELFISDCLLQLRRFVDVLDRCRKIKSRFAELGTRFEEAQALLNEAVAYAGLHRYDAAMNSLAQVRRLFTEEGSRVWMACADLEVAALLLRQSRFEESLTTAQVCADVFQAHSLPVKEAQAHLIAARAAAALNQQDQVLRLVTEMLTVAESRDIPSLTYQGYHLLGALAAAEGDLEKALAEYHRAIQELERLRGQLMVEFRVDFVEDKQVVYEDMVCLCLDTAQPLQALEYAERAKSRALLDLLAYRLDLSLQARSVADRPLVEELTRLRTERDRVYRRWEGREESQEEDWAGAEKSRAQMCKDVLGLEKQITGLWHRLLIRNADYACDASLWQVRVEPVQLYAMPETALLEYFIVHRQLVAFWVTGETVQVRRLPGDPAQVQRLIQLFWLNLKAVPKSTPDQVANLSANAQGLLKRLHGLLVEPLGDAIALYPRLIVVPHGALHYLPFHALHDGQRFLLEQHEISYLPGSSLLRYCKDVEPAASGLLAFGHSYGGRLPHAVQEAQAVAALLGGRTFLEDEATLTRLQKAAGDCRTIHLATHGEFRPDNPLFSGLALADGWLTTLDTFNLHLRASLVALSACRTGQNVIGGGDELLGLMRAFLYAGAASVLLSLWAVEDCCTAQLMEIFYRKLVEGWAKGAALRYAQRQFIQTQSTGGRTVVERYAHPYFWAPFFLVGDAGPL